MNPIFHKSLSKFKVYVFSIIRHRFSLRKRNDFISPTLGYNLSLTLHSLVPTTWYHKICKSNQPRILKYRVRFCPKIIPQRCCHLIFQYSENLFHYTVPCHLCYLTSRSTIWRRHISLKRSSSFEYL